MEDSDKGDERAPEENAKVKPARTKAPKEAPQPEFAGEMLTYLPGEGDKMSTTWRGLTFKAGVPRKVLDESMVESARGNKHFRVGDEDKPTPGSTTPTTAMEYRGYVLEWMKGVTSVDELIRHFAADRELRSRCEVSFDDIRWLGTLIEPRLRELKMADGLNDDGVNKLWMSHGIFDLPWKS